MSPAAHDTDHATNGISTSMEGTKPIILHLGDKIMFNKGHYDRLDKKYHILRPPLTDLNRENFIRHLQDKKWGNFSAIIRPFWNTGGEMGKWDRQLIELLPENLKVIASAGAGYDWVRTDILGQHGTTWILLQPQNPHADGKPY